MLWAENSTGRTKYMGFTVDASNFHSAATSQSYLFFFFFFFFKLDQQIHQLEAFQGTGVAEQ